METWFKADRERYKITEEIFDRSTDKRLFWAGHKIYKFRKNAGGVPGKDISYFDNMLDAILQVRKWHVLEINKLKRSITREDDKAQHFLKSHSVSAEIKRKYW